MMVRRIGIVIAMTVGVLGCNEERTVTAMPMPGGFETVRLGMTWDALVAVRPEVHRDDFYSDEVVAFEELAEHDDFSSVVYSFFDGRLSEITLSRSAIRREVAERCTGLMNDSIVRWGEPTSKTVGIISNHPITHADHEYPVLVWRDRSVTIVAKCIVTSAKKHAPNFYSVAIIDPTVQTTGAWEVGIVPDATSSDFDRVLQELTRRDSMK